MYSFRLYFYWSATIAASRRGKKKVPLLLPLEVVDSHNLLNVDDEVTNLYGFINLLLTLERSMYRVDKDRIRTKVADDNDVSYFFFYDLKNL